MKLPIHPMLVHFPIAFFFLEFFLLLLWHFRKDDIYRGFAVLTFHLALLFLIPTLAAGWLAAGGWEHITGEVREHFFGAVSVAVIQSARGLYWQFGKPNDDKGRGLLILSAIAGLAAVIYTGYHGAEIVYGD
jgi:uncharacterized membrane protein